MDTTTAPTPPPIPSDFSMYTPAGDVAVAAMVANVLEGASSPFEAVERLDASMRRLGATKVTAEVSDTEVREQLRHTFRAQFAARGWDVSLLEQSRIAA